MSDLVSVAARTFLVESSGRGWDDADVDALADLIRQHMKAAVDEAREPDWSQAHGPALSPNEELDLVNQAKAAGASAAHYAHNMLRSLMR